jgi:hypothetical protein
MAKRGNAGDSTNEPSEKSFSKNSRSTRLSEKAVLRGDERNNLLSDLDAPVAHEAKKPKTPTESKGSHDAQKGTREVVDSVNTVLDRASNKRYKGSSKDVHPAGSYCAATKHEPGTSKCLPAEQLKALIAQAQARANEGANEGDSKVSRARPDAQLQTAQSVHIAQNLDLRSLDKGQGAAIKYQASKLEPFTPQGKHTEQGKHSELAKDTEPAKHSEPSTQKQTSESVSEAKTSSESPVIKPSKNSRSFSAPEYQIHQESLDFYQTHKKAFQAADQRFQNLPVETPPPSQKVDVSARKAEPTPPLRKQQFERIDPYYALNYQLAKENSLFNPPQGDYKVKSIEQADPKRHPDALALDIPESRILHNVPAYGAQQILNNAEHAASGIPIRAGEIIDSIEAMMEGPEASSNHANTQVHEDNDERRLIMLLDGKHKGLLFPVKRSGEQAKHEGTITSITKIFLPDGNFKFVRGDKAAGRFHLPNIKELIAKIKAKVVGKTQTEIPAKDQEKTVRTSEAIFPQTIVSPQHTGTIVIKDLKPGTAEPEPLASQLTKAQKTKQEEAKKQEAKESRPESKTGNKDAYQGRLPEIKMSYSKNQSSTKDFTKLRPHEKHPIKETGEVKETIDADHSTRIRDIYAKFDIQLPRKKLKPEITESGTYKIVSNQTSQNLPVVSEDKMNAPDEVASFFQDDDSFPGGDPRNPENKPFPKITTSVGEEPRQSYVVKQGETIEYIAVAELHEAGLAPLIREINEILLEQFYDHEKQEPVSILPAGVLILLPNKKDTIAYRLRVARNRH